MTGKMLIHGKKTSIFNFDNMKYLCLHADVKCLNHLQIIK
jgi:hypothetical protein